MVKLDNEVTKINPRHITTVFFNRLVTARVEQMPKIWAKTGFLGPTSSKKIRFTLPLLSVVDIINFSYNLTHAAVNGIH